MSKTVRIIAALLLLIGVVLGFRSQGWGSFPVLAQEIDEDPPPRDPEPIPPVEEEVVVPKLSTAETRLIEGVASMNGLDADHLLVGYSEELNLPLTGVAFTVGKVQDPATGIEYDIALDANGSVVDAQALRDAEWEAYFALYGKLNPSLYNYIQSMKAEATVQVSIWLKMGELDASMPRISAAQAEALSLEQIEQIRAEGIARAAEIHHQVQSPLIELLPSLGGTLIEAPDNAPILLVEIPVQAIQQIADLSYVDTIDLLVSGGPEDDGGEGEKTGLESSELNSSRPTSKANIVNSRGFDGTGVKVAVVEGDSIAFDNPYLDGSCGPTTTCPSIDAHATAVGGFIASNNTTYKGVAPGIGSGLLSANGSGWELTHHQDATSWANGQGADIYNNSYYLEEDGLMHNSDRWMDYIVRNNADLEVKSAGNLGTSTANVTSPGLGYNTLTVGGYDDKDTLTWDDDVMYASSSYNEPSGREKPEVVAPACGISGTTGMISTTTTSPWTGDVGCGTSYAAPIVSGGAALLIDRAAGLSSWPEAERAIFIATALHNIEGDAVKSEQDGAGGVDLAAADLVAANGWWSGDYVTGSSFDASYYFVTQTITLYAGEPMRAALAYDSHPSGDYTSDALEGDLDLYLKDPSDSIVASSYGVDSWEVLAYTPALTGTYTLVVENHNGSLETTEGTYLGTAIWPGHYVLSGNASQTRDMPSGNYNQDSGDDYRYTRSSYWNVVGLWPAATADYDIFLFGKSVYGDPADHAWLEDSTLSGNGTVDIVAVDGNHAPSGDYFTTVSRYGGSGSYITQAASWTTDLTAENTYGPYSATTQSVRVWDTYFAAGATKYFCVKPTSGTADLGVLLFDSTSGTSSTYYQGKSQAVASVDVTGAGGREYLVYTSADGDYKGLVVYNKSGSSTGYTVKVSASPIVDCAPVPVAPSGTVNVLKPTFQWTAYPGATSYNLAVYYPTIGAYLFIDSVAPSYCTNLICTYTSKVNIGNGNFRFKVMAYAPNGNTPYSAYMNFTISGVTLPPPPYPPTPISPTGTFTTTHRPTFTWSQVPDAYFYRLGVLHIATNTYTILLNVYPVCSAGQCSYSHPTIDLANGNYKWKVLARNSTGMTAYSSWMNFTMSCNLPVAPTLVGPTGTVGVNPPTFQWNPVSGATKYRLAVYSLGTSSYVIQTDVYPTACTSTLCSYTPATALASNNYKFKMMTYNSYGASGYSDWMSFTVP